MVTISLTAQGFDLIIDAFNSTGRNRNGGVCDNAFKMRIQQLGKL